jgi:ABC-2 type transport system permease protein
MFKVFLSRELRGALKSPMVYIFIFIYALLVFGAVSSDNVVIGGTVGNIKKNAPYVLATFVSVLSIFGLLFAAAFFNNAALRDFQNQFHEILFSTPLKKSSFFFGRFLGALVLSTLPFLGIYLGAWIAALVAPAVGWLDPERIGPFYPAMIINTFFLFVVPNMLLGGSIIFWLAHRFRNTIVSFLGALIIIMAYIISGTLLSDVENQTLAALTDPFGIRTYSVFTRYFTPLEKNTLSPVFEGLMLQNRLIWIGVSLLITGLSFWNFSTKERKARLKRKSRKKDQKPLAIAVSKPRARTIFGMTTGWKQFVSFYRTANRSIIRSTVFQILFLFCAIILISNMVGGFEYFGLQSYPVTYKMTGMVAGNTAIFIMIILVFFSGELVWRDRMYHIEEVVNATPHNSLSGLFAKTLSLVSVAVLLHLFFFVIAILYQLIMGYANLELNVYLGSLILDSLPGYLLYSLLFIFLQAIVSNRYIGYFVSVLFLFVLDIIWVAFDIQTNMLRFGGGPSLFYSDMNGFGSGLTGAFWFNLYWLLFALILLLIAGLFITRSSVSSVRARWKVARKNLSPRYALGLGAIVVVWLATAGFVYYNTQMLNSYVTSDESEVLRADYEKMYKQYEEMPLPKLTSVRYFIDLYPEERDVITKAEVVYQNKTNQVIDSLFFSVDTDWEIEIDLPGINLIDFDKEHGFQIYELKPPLQPGASLKGEIRTKYLTKGFENSAGSRSICNNGTFLNNSSILPSLGYQEGYELLDKNDRRKYDLKPKKRIPELREDCGELCMINYLTDGVSDWVEVETTISTTADQIAIAPGSLIDRWEKGGRNYFRYRVDHPSQDFYSFMSADYEVATRKWNDIDLEVYYDEKHPYNIEMMLDAIQMSLEYYTENFGPYYHKQARIIEFPRYSTFAQAFPGTMPYSESFGFITNLEDTTENNVVNAVIAHEMAHQYWAHQEIPAKMQGGTMLTESFSEYSSLMVMKESKSAIEMKDFLKYDFDRYLRGRSSETIKEVPLYKVENQGYIHYGKGALVLYALQDYIGEDSVNSALRSFLEEFRYKEPPYPNSYDFLRHLEPRVPDSLQYLITDWFKEISLYDLRLEEATARELEDGSYAVSISIEAAKIKADTIGNETRLIPNDWIDIGLFADDDAKELLTIKRVKVDRENMQFELHAQEKPARAAIDPKRLLIERIIDDNMKSVDYN